MKTLSANMLAHLAGETTTLATCWKLTRTDTTIMRFTDHDGDIVIGGDGTYKAATGFSGSAISSTSNMRVDELEVQAILDAADITEADLVAGLYDYAQIQVFMVNYEVPADGTIVLRKGFLGEVRLSSSGIFFTEVRGMMQQLQNTFGEVLTATCRADLGDSRCGVNLVPLTVSGTVATITTDLFKFTSTQTDGQVLNYWQYGQLTWTSGTNSGFVHDVKYSEDDDIELFNPTPYTIDAGDGFDVYPGCDKRIGTCNTKFTNVENFRGEPHLPGADAVVKFAGGS
jgi:uncharacterized phage protein (TIGR02218 family)